MSKRTISNFNIMKEEFILFETKFWRVILSDEQSYLGRCVILLKRDCGELSNLTSDEWLDFHANIVKKLESTFKKVFDATMFNWTCLMNNAYQVENPKPYVIGISDQDIITVLNLQEKNSEIHILLIIIIARERILFQKNYLKKFMMK